MVLFISSLQNNMPIRLFSHLMLKPRWNAIKWKGEIYTIQFHSDYFLNCFNISCYFSSSINFFIPSINYISLISSIVSIPFGLLLQLFQFHLACIYVCLYNWFKHILMILSNPTPGKDLDQENVWNVTISS